MRRRNRNIERANYYNDNRVNPVNGDDLLTIDEEEMVCNVNIPEAPDVDISLEYEVCPLCNGKGKHTNPSIDAGGIPAREFQRDPEFADRYFSGAYDVSCNRCDGKRVVPKPAPSSDKEDEAFLHYLEALEVKREHQRTRNAERAMGA